MNFTWWAEILEGGVTETSEPVDGRYVFATVASARKALADHYAEMAVCFRERAAEARRMRRSDAEPARDR